MVAYMVQRRQLYSQTYDTCDRKQYKSTLIYELANVYLQCYSRFRIVAVANTKFQGVNALVQFTTKRRSKRVG